MHLIFFLALLIIIFGARIFSSSSKESINRSIQQAYASEEEWMNAENLNARSNGFYPYTFYKNESVDTILDEVKPCYDSIFAQTPFAEVCPPNTWPQRSKDAASVERLIRLGKERAICILCAKRGYAYENGPHSKCVTFFKSRIDREVMRWCRDELVRNGKNVALVERVVYINGRETLNEFMYLPSDMSKRWKIDGFLKKV